MKTKLSTPAANTAAVVTLAAEPGVTQQIHWIVYSYSIAPTNGRLTITDDGVTVLDLDIGVLGILGLGQAGSVFVENQEVNTDLVVTLAAGGLLNKGKLNVGYN